jgi:hypothetical protein
MFFVLMLLIGEEAVQVLLTQDTHQRRLLIWLAAKT